VFCDTPCLKLATADIRRLHDQISRLEDRLSNLRTISEHERTGWESDPKLLQAEVERLRARLLALLRLVEAHQ
jgi:hypothetical protein